MNNFSSFVDRLIEEKGFNETDPEVMAQIKSDLEQRLEDRVNAMLVSELPEDQFEPFQKILDGGKEDEIVAFVKQHVPGLDEKIAAELLVFRNIYLG